MDFELISKEKSIVILKLINEYNFGSTQLFPYANCKIKVWLNQKSKEYIAYSQINIVYSDNCDVILKETGETEDVAVKKLLTKYIMLYNKAKEVFNSDILPDECYQYIPEELF